MSGSGFPPGDDLSGRSAHAGAMLLAAQGVSFALGVGSTMILARLLQPADFGLIAMALTYVAFVGVFNDFGLPMAAVQRARLDPSHASALFWLGAGLSLGVAAATLALAPAIAAFYDEPRLVQILGLMAIVFVAVGLGALPQGLLRRDLRFGVVTSAELAATVAGIGVAVGLGWTGAGYWALAAQYPVTAVVRTVWLWRACGWRPTRPSPWSEVRGMISYGGDVTLYRIVNHLGKHLDRIVIGHHGGAGPLGFYTAADRWAMYPVQQVYPPLLSVAVAGLSRVRDDPERYRRYFTGAYGPLLAAILPGLAFLFVASDAFVLVLLGSRWAETAPLLRILLVGAFASAIGQFTKWIYLVEGRTRTQLAWGTMSSVVMAGSVVLAAPSGTTAVAATFSAMTCLLTVPGIARCLAGSALRPIDVVGAAWRPVVASLMAAGLTLVFGLIAPAVQPLARLVAGALLFTTLYVGTWVVIPGGRQAAADLIRLAAKVRLAGRAGRAAPVHGSAAGESAGRAGS